VPQFLQKAAPPEISVPQLGHDWVEINWKLLADDVIVAAESQLVTHE
jgi:hypothetical protein